MVPAVTLLYSVLLLSLLWLAHGREISYQGALLQWTSRFRPCDCLKAAGDNMSAVSRCCHSWRCSCRHGRDVACAVN